LIVLFVLALLIVKCIENLHLLEKISEVLEMKPKEVVAFNESMVFNVMHNQNGGNVFGDINNTVSDTERQLY
jgi:hypothetical protein